MGVFDNYLGNPRSLDSNQTRNLKKTKDDMLTIRIQRILRSFRTLTLILRDVKIATIPHNDMPSFWLEWESMN